MATSILFEEQIEIPMNIRSLDDFRQWARSDEFPERGRIDFIRGRIEVDMADEDFFFHANPKTEFVVVVGLSVRDRKMGHLCVDQTRISNPAADLSAEPDLLFVSYEALREGRVRLILGIISPTALTWL